jgi:hypothetical protein
MGKPGFMSPEHIAVMNDLLERSDAVRAACLELDEPFTMGYELEDGPDGNTVHWSMAFAETVRFSLDKVDADLLFRGDWARMVRATRDSREGRPTDPGVEAVGDMAGFQKVAPVFAVAQSVATVPVEFPDV